MNNIFPNLLAHQKGHWGFVFRFHERAFANRIIDVLTSIPNKYLVHIVTQQLIEDPISLRNKLIESINKTLRDSRYRSICFVINSFEQLNDELQCEILRATRGFREEFIAHKQIQFVVMGSWNRYNLKEEWKRRSDSSPCLDQKNIKQCEFFLNSELLELLHDERLLDEGSREYKIVLAAAFRELTGADQELIGVSVAFLRDTGIGAAQVIDRIDDIAATEDVVHILNKRLEYLNDICISKLLSVLRYGQVIAQADDAVIEDLRLAGFVSVKLQQTKNVVSLSSPLVEVFLRRFAKDVRSEFRAVCSPDDLLFPLTEINAAANRIVLRIETRLRNFVVLVAASSKSKQWTELVEYVRVPKGQQEELMERSRVLLSEFKGLFPDLFSPEVNIDNVLKGANIGDSTPEKESIVSRAKGWQRRSARLPYFAATRMPLLQFLTLGDLRCVYEYVKAKEEPLIASVFSNTAELQQYFAEFIALRNAVAHNWIIDVAIVKRLLDLEWRIEVAVSNSVSKKMIESCHI